MNRSILVLAMISLPLAAQAADSIRPGYWETTDKVLSPIQSTKVEHKCVTPADVGKFMACRINHHYECACPLQSFADGQIRFEGACVGNKGEKARISGQGAYTPTTFQLTAHVATRWNGLPLSIDASTDAHRIGDVCPPGAK